MTNRSTLAYSRLAALALFVGLLATFACRPAWSPDGKKLVYPALTGPKEISIALYDRDTGKASLLQNTPVHKNLPALAWSPDGKQLVVVHRAETGAGFQIKLHSIPDNGEPRVFEALRVTKVESFDVFLAPPVIVGTHLFLSFEGIVRIDLVSGEEKRLDAGKDRALIVFARGDGLGYLSVAKAEKETDWELGTVDPATLELTTLLKAPEGEGWKAMPLPTFTKDLSRIAMPARKGKGHEEQAILVFRDGKLETVLPLGTDYEVGVSSLHWARDDVTLLVSLCRRDEGEQLDAWVLHETMIGGSVTRETTVLRTAQGKDKEAPRFSFPMALSPDGKTAAFSTAMIEGVDAEDAGLYLMDLTSKDRKVTRVPFPTREEK